MAITHISSAATMPASASASNTVTAPAGVVADDLLVALFGLLSSTVVVTDPSGFTAEGEQANGTNLRARVLTRVAGAEPASYVWTLATALKTAAWIGAYAGVHPTTPIHDFALGAGSSSATFATPAVDVTDGGWLIYGVVTRHTPGALGVATWSTDGSGDAERWDSATNAGSADITAAVYDSGAAMDAASAVTRTLTSSLTEGVAVTFALSLTPADAPTPDPGGGSSTEPRPGVPVF